jgi:hypothetical protein
MKRVILLAGIVIPNCINAITASAQQNVGIGTNSPAASAMLHVNSTSKGLLMPRLTTAQRTAIASPANGLQVYDTNTNSFWFYKSTAWVELGAAGGSGASFWSSNEFGSIYNTNSGNIGIGTQFPGAKLHVIGDGSFAGQGITLAYSEQGGYYYNGGALLLSTAVSAIETRAIRVDGSGIQAFTVDTDDPSVDDYASGLSLNALGGNLGIGTSNSSNSKVTIQTDADYNTALVLRNPSNSARFEAYIGGPVNNNTISLGTQGAMPIALFTNGANRMFIHNNGNVGIGVDFPTFSKLEIRIAAEQRGWAVGTPTYNMHTFLGGAGRSTNSEGCYLGTSGVVTGGAAAPLHFFTNAQWAQMTLLPNGNVGIGTTNPTYKLAVNGNVRSKEVIVESDWADYVFDKNYTLLSLTETEQYIQQHQHLPGIPSATDIKNNGLMVGEVQAKMMAKIEELTLHIIRQQKQIDALQQKLNLQH